MTRKQKPSPEAESGTSFIRKTITLPTDLEPFAVKRAKEPQHAGNLSSYVRSLIIRDREQQEHSQAA